MSTQLKIAVIGLGEAGERIGVGLVNAGAEVSGFDLVKPKKTDIPLAESIEEAVSDADVILSLNSSTLATRYAQHIAPLVKPGAIFADVNSGTPTLKRKLAEEFATGSFVDVALMGSIEDLGLEVPMAVSGEAGERFISLMAPFGMDLEFVSDVPGDAAARHLIRSMLSKGLTGVVIDTLWAAESLGIQQWAWEEIQREFDALTAEKIHDNISETSVYFKRQQIEIVDVVEMVADSGYESTMMPPVQFNYGRIMHSKKIPFAKPKEK